MKPMLYLISGLLFLSAGLLAGGIITLVMQFLGLASQETGGLGLLAVLGGAALLAYLIPSIVAANRQHHQIGAIATLNLLLGWTFLGWAAALVWAMTATRGLLAAPVQPVE